MSKIRILIADDNLLAAQTLRDNLNEYDDFEVTNIAQDGFEAIELIEKDSPDVVLLDIIMPKLDGIGVLEYAGTLTKESRPVFIVFSAISQEIYISRAMNLGANYYIIKPFDESVIATRVRQLYSDSERAQIGKSQYTYKIRNNYKQKNQSDNELKLLATKYMRECGLKAHMTGYSYIRDIITAAFDYYCKTGSLPKGVYRTIAEKNGVPVQKVERAIRNCIEKGIDGSEEGKKPTNSQVLCQIIDKIRKNN
ncbi:response regulator [Ruminiclostridium cellulolyticum]|uniref:Stage 0 sporulation protein A homolog n=1 Tax=Ruminiclostridium cellulolyticum (strain ATCC 35319 / DSM 5812 / JCM 6584 / H10) TaxID=394503 RepID=B8I5L9_RUMCH|nr:response regulator [Ruminiclostridium cellulolyticum]ACL76755.1 response regulator receiver protein [Ruminiclostridium cellulolyticum H10]